ncbi:hypothetical protein M5D96_010212, partial [Drosophila gunungcola]
WAYLQAINNHSLASIWSTFCSTVLADTHTLFGWFQMPAISNEYTRIQIGVCVYW